MAAMILPKSHQSFDCIAYTIRCDIEASEMTKGHDQLFGGLHPPYMLYVATRRALLAVWQGMA
jgi:hypothetical protein